MELKEFKTDISKKRGVGRRKPVVTNSYGVYDCYKAIRKNKWFNIGRPLNEKEFYAIIRGINKLLAQELSKGNTVKFPSGMGELELRKFESGVAFVHGELKNTYPIDWSKTWDLWYQDAEEKQKKTLVRYETPYVYYIKYITAGIKADYENKTFYQFALNRKIKKALKENIINRKVDTLW